MNKSQKYALNGYALLLLFFTVILFIPSLYGIYVEASILQIASDGFKTVLGAIIGALSTIFAGNKRSSN